MVSLLLGRVIFVVVRMVFVIRVLVRGKGRLCVLIICIRLSVLVGGMLKLFVFFGISVMVNFVFLICV